MFEVFSTGVAVDVSKITALYIKDFGVGKNKVYIVRACVDGGFQPLIEYKTADGAKSYIKDFADELNALKDKMFRVFPTGVAVDVSKITALHIEDFYFNKEKTGFVTAWFDCDCIRLIECKIEDDAKNFLKNLADELNALKGN